MPENERKTKIKQPNQQRGDEIMENGTRKDGMLTVTEVARMLHVHPNTLRRWSKDGRIPSYRIAPRGDRRYKQEEIARFLAELNAEAGNG
jgi:excisionase family DNA binding protein